MQDDYTIENLVKTFSKHSESFEESQEEMIIKFKANNPEDPLPAHFTDEFNVSKALWAMCSEIEKIRGILIRRGDLAIRDFLFNTQIKPDD